MDDLVQEGKFLDKIFGKAKGADTAADAGRAVNAAGDEMGAMDKLGAVYNRLTGNSTPPTQRISPTGDVDFPPNPAVWRGRGNPDKGTSLELSQELAKAKPYSWLDDIPNTGGGMGLNPPKAVTNVSNSPWAPGVWTDPPKVDVTPPKVDAKPTRKRLTKDEQIAKRRADELAQAKHDAEVARIRKGDADAKAAAELDDITKNAGIPKAAPKADAEVPTAAPKADAEVPVDDPAEVARLRQELEDRLQAGRSTPEPELTLKQRLEKANKDLDDAKTEKQIKDAELEIKRLRGDPVEPTANNAPANNAPANNAPANNAPANNPPNNSPASTISVADEPKKTYADRANDLAKSLDATSDVLAPVGKLTRSVAGLGATAAASAPLITNIGSDEYGADVFKDYASFLGYGKSWGGDAKKKKEDKPETPETPATADPNAPKPWSPADIEIDPPPTQQESISTILKLSGQRPITERDNTVGITKPRAIRTLTENTNLAECGMGSPSYSQPASFSINASASSGDEVANMLKSIMHLAGVKPVTGDMLGAEMLPQVHDMEIISASPEMMSMPEMDHDDMGHAEVIEIDGVMGDHDEEEKVGEEYDNTPHPKVDNEDPLRKWANVVNKHDMSTIPPGAPGDNKLQNTLGNSPVKEATDVHNSLLKAYEAFKNS